MTRKQEWGPPYSYLFGTKTIRKLQTCCYNFARKTGIVDGDLCSAVESDTLKYKTAKSFLLVIYSSKRITIVLTI